VDSYQKPVDEIFSLLKARPTGLNTEEVALRLEAHGYNELETKTSINPLIIFINQFKSFITYILLFAVVFSLLIGEDID